MRILGEGTAKYIIYSFISVFYVFKNPKSKTMALLTAIYSSSFGNGPDAKSRVYAAPPPCRCTTNEYKSGRPYIYIRIMVVV